jgi:hypothetical protein
LDEVAGAVFGEVAGAVVEVVGAVVIEVVVTGGALATVVVVVAGALATVVVVLAGAWATVVVVVALREYPRCPRAEAAVPNPMVSARAPAVAVKMAVRNGRRASKSSRPSRTLRMLPLPRHEPRGRWENSCASL